MNANNNAGKFSLRNALTNVQTKTAAVGTALMLSPIAAMAQDFDPAPIVSKTVAYTAIGVTILGAFALAVWTLKAMGLIGGKR